MHNCNPFCQGGFHAILVDPSPAELAVGVAKPESFERTAGVIASSAGLQYAGSTEVRNDALLGPPGTITKFGATRGRVIVWARRAGE